MMKYLTCNIDPQKLMTAHELTDYFERSGADGMAVYALSERLRQQLGKDLIVQYPFGAYGYDGAFFIPVREGVACLRYNVVELDRREIISLDASELVEHKHVRWYLAATVRESRRLCQAFCDMERLLVGDSWSCGLRHRLKDAMERWKAVRSFPSKF